MGINYKKISQGSFLIYGEMLASPVGVHPISPQWVVLAEPVAMLGKAVENHRIINVGKDL